MRAAIAGIGLLLAGTLLYGAVDGDFNWGLLALGMALLYGSIFCLR